MHFDYFSVDFNEEFSALYGGSLSRLPVGDSQIFRLYVFGPSGKEGIKFYHLAT